MHLLDIYIISDSMGETGALVAKSAISQFKTQDYRIKRFPYIHKIDELKTILGKASLKPNTIIVYTLVEKKLANYLEEYTSKAGILSIDIMNPIIEALEEKLESAPSREPGIIRKLDDDYFSRVAAIEFAVKYDDGKDPEGFHQAEIVLAGVSRTSKTPLSMYLANKNIKVANIPLVLEVPPPKALFEIPSTKVIGLTNSPEKLNEIREERLKSLGLGRGSSYATYERILDELEYAERIMKKIGCPIIDVSNKAIEETADIILNFAFKNSISFNLL
ncbi:MAG: pyruvate, water dikinase regulatory protein [Tissierella sp.]|uniref:pyruvate, water dikinase regulatory protein n=1 Tax=Tissierella sp. TaxID=41274 RepID=UPI003F94814C